MKKAISLVLAAALCAGVLAGCGQSQSSSAAGTSSGSQAAADGSKELNLFTWVGMFPDEVISDFEAETGIKVNYSNFDTDETMLQKLSQAKGGDYDLVIADDYIIETAIAQGLVAELDTS